LAGVELQFSAFCECLCSFVNGLYFNLLVVVVNHHLQGGYVFVVVCLLATLSKNFQPDLHEIFREGCLLASEQVIKLWWHSMSEI